MTSMRPILPLSDVRARVGESPVWSARDDCLYSVDIWSNRLWRHDADGNAKQYAMPEMAAAVVVADRGVLVALESHLLHGEPQRGDWHRIAAPLDHPPTHRFNDACVDPMGRLIIGTMRQSHLGPEPTGTLYCFADRQWTVLAQGFWTCNGLAVSPNGRRLYVSDSHPEVQTIWTMAYDPATGGIGPRKAFAKLHALPGRPDGAAVDRLGGYWIAGVGGNCLHRFDEAGALLGTIPVPVENPTKMAFGGPGLATLFVTSMSERLTKPDPSGLAGVILSVDVGVVGLPSVPFVSTGAAR